MCSEKHILVKKMFTNELNIVFFYDVPELKRQSIEWKHIDSPVKNKFWVQQSVKKVMLTVFWNMKGPITLEKGATVNSASYYHLLSQYFTLITEWLSL